MNSAGIPTHQYPINVALSPELVSRSPRKNPTATFWEPLANCYRMAKNIKIIATAITSSVAFQAKIRTTHRPQVAHTSPITPR